MSTKTTWVIDPTHSEIGFRIRHLMISHVSGSFRDFSGTVRTDGDDFTAADIQLEVDMASINTNNAQRDSHLQQSDFFDAALHPTMNFRSTGMSPSDGDTWILSGDLTMRGVTQNVKLNVEFNGLTKDPWGNQRAGFSLSGKLNRSDFGISFNGVMETGGVMLGEDVRILCEVELVKQEVAEPALA